MSRLQRSLALLTGVLTVGVVIATPAAAQVTTGTLSGVVADEQGGVLPGAVTIAIHEPTGTTYEGVTLDDGRFVFQNVRVGGPYSVTVRMAGFKEQVQKDVVVSLGEDTALQFKMPLETVQEMVTVSAEASSVFTGARTGTSATVSEAAIETLPTVQRSLQDFARVNPFVSQTATNANDSALSIAGRSGRYNNLQIDGAVNNDLFGLADSGTPGGPASTQPVSLDAIQELQIVVSPYDVRQGGFSGGGINAITRTGTNRLRGTAYFFSRDQDLVGDGADDRPIATFSDKQFGGSVGGPIVRNRAFFFSNLDWGRRDTPSGYSVDGSSGQTFGRQPEIERAVNILKTKYGYDPGGLGEFIRQTDNNKVFVRGDVNFGTSQLMLRNNYVDAVNDVLFPSITLYKTPDQNYTFNSQANSTVGQLNSTIGSTMFNEFRVGYQRIRDFRSTVEEFPQVTMRLVGGGSVRFGTEQFSTANELDQDIIELHDDLTWVRGKHNFTFGTHNEFFKFRNLFIRDNFGTYEFANVDQLDAGLAQAYDYSFSRTADAQQAARFWVYQFGFYAGDQWRFSNRMTLTYGLRLDFPIFPDEPTANPTVEAIYGKRTDVTPSSQTWSPRAGFNWDLSRDQVRQQFRIGAGMFGGRTPYVWLSNQYTNTGNEFTRVTASYNVNNRIPFVPDPRGQPTNVGNAATNEINLVDPDYAFPRLFRGNVGFDRSLGFLGLVGTVEFLFSQAMKDIDYDNLNLVQAGTRPDGRPFYARANSTYSDVVYLTNTADGGSYDIAFKVDRPFRNRWYASAAYRYGNSETVNDGGSSQARSNWINNWFGAFDINNPPAGISNFDPGHRINLAAAYQIPLWRRANVTLSAYYNGQTGRPYAYRYFNDVNVDAGSTNDLAYIPASASDIVLRNGTYEQLAAFIGAGDCSDLPSGGINPRNICRSPWTNNLDFRAAFDVPFGRYKAEFEFALLNMINLFDSDNGLIDYASFNGVAIASAAVDAATGKWAYTLSNEVLGTVPRYTRDDLRSRWQGQFGFRFRF
jgi:hypothetical protein